MSSHSSLVTLAALIATGLVLAAHIMLSSTAAFGGNEGWETSVSPAAPANAPAPAPLPIVPGTTVEIAVPPHELDEKDEIAALERIQYALSEVGDGNVCWTLHPAYAAWFWPLMLKATSLALLVPESLLEPASADDSTIAPRPPTEEEKSAILKAPEREQDAVRVYSLVLKGKQPSVRKAFPTRTVSLAALRYCRVRINADPKTPSA